MNTTSSVLLAGQLDLLGGGLLTTLGSWADKGLKVGLAVLVLAAIARSFSFKAALGALLAMVIALGIYNGRDSLSGKVTDEIKNPANGAGIHTVVIDPGRKTGVGPTLGDTA
ncbi:hypothetical protein ACFXD5_23845 [Streptomyces sp. NPDC059385]|uniref:hypothetical protein n=1 Tax=Streptomyces sp. NPDC059385 TaxID=3346817 RepID=UPI0036BF024C